MLKVGDTAPDFTLPSDDRGEVTLSALKGRRVVLYFYPKDDTPGCTTQACDFRDRMLRIEDVNAIVLGVSPDDVESHQRFREKYDLPFALLADVDHAVADAYGAWGEKKLYGKTYEGILRTTFLIDEDGKIAGVFERVKAKGHGDAVLTALQKA